jgi:general secretion pathway protein D
MRLEVTQEASSIATGADRRRRRTSITNRRAITTTVLADNGQTIVLGGLTADDYTEATRQQVPILGDIPVVGELFKSRRESAGRSGRLFVFLKPTILRDGADAAKRLAKDRYATGCARTSSRTSSAEQFAAARSRGRRG